MFMLSLFFATSSAPISPALPVLFFLVGVVLVILGFRTYRQYRILADTPQIPIRSVAMGLVHVAGKSTGGNPLTSPLSRVPCYYYRVQVEKWVKKDKQEKWVTTGNESAESEFYLEDETGRILVKPHHAQYDVPHTFRGGMGPKALGSARFFDTSLGVPVPTEQHLHAYLTGEFSPARAALQSSSVPGAHAMSKALGMAQKMQALGVSIGDGALRLDFGVEQSYRFTETCLVAGRPCQVLGTCAENPSPAEEHDRNLIQQGQNEKTFLITTQTEKGIEKSLRRRAVVLLLIGNALILGAAAVALHMAHLL